MRWQQLALHAERPLLHVRVPRLRRLADRQERVGRRRGHARRREAGEQRVRRLQRRRLADRLGVVAAADVRIDVGRAVDLAPFGRVEEHAVAAADDGLLADRPPGESEPRREHLEAIRVLGAAPAGVLVVRAVDDAAVHQRLVGHEQAAGRVVEVAPRHAIVGLVGHVPVVPAKAQVDGQLRADAPVVLEVRREVLEVELARVAGGSRHAVRRRLEDADARVVPEQHVGDEIAGEPDVVGVVAEEPRRQIALEPPAAIVDAEVQRVAAR